MKVNDNKSIAGVKVGAPVPEVRATVPGEAKGAIERPEDKVSVDQAREVMRQLESARSSGIGARSSRLREIEAAVRSGTYRPSASRVAEEILSAAELDARIRAMFMK